MCRELAWLVEWKPKYGDTFMYYGSILPYLEADEDEAEMQAPIYPYQTQDASKRIWLPTIEQLLEILRERVQVRAWFMWECKESHVIINEKGIADGRKAKTFKGDTLKEALLRATIAVMREQSYE